MTEDSPEKLANYIAILHARKDFTSGNLSDAQLQGVDFRGCKMEGVMLDGANLTDANFQGCDLYWGLLFDANFTNADLSHSKLNGANLKDANFSGANLCGTDFGNDAFGRPANLEGANFKNAFYDKLTIFPSDFDLREKEMIYKTAQLA